MSKKNLIILFLLIIFTAIIILVFFILKGDKKITAPTFNGSGQIGELPIPNITDNNMKVMTKSGEIEEINNLYKKPIKDVSLTENYSIKEIIINENSDYSISYYPQDGGFLIAILNPNIKKAREEAENVFLAELGVDKNTACKLKVFLSVPYGVNKDASGKAYGLSFCPDGIPFEK